MSGIEIKITLDSAQLEAALDRAIAGGDDLHAPMTAIVQMWKRLVDERFEREVDPWAFRGRSAGTMPIRAARC